MVLLNRNDLQIYQGDSFDTLLTFKDKSGNGLDFTDKDIYFTVRDSTTEELKFQTIFNSYLTPSTILVSIASSDNELPVGTYLYAIRAVGTDTITKNTLVVGNYLIVKDVSTTSA